jgi:uncharacterized protein (TIGR03083 family)
MTLGRTVVVPGMIVEYRAFSGLLRNLSADEWQAPSRCEGWTAADVAGHVVGQITDVSVLRLDGLGTPEVTDRQVRERRGRGPDALADELDTSTESAAALAAAFDDQAWEAPGPPGTPGTLGQGLESLWFDTFLHADDIRQATGRPPVLGDGLLPSVSHITQILTDQEWRPATLRLDGMEEFPISGGGQLISGDPMTFILVSTGRAEPTLMGLDESVNIYR